MSSAGEVPITVGAMQGIDLVNTLLARPGDTVIVEAFSFAGALGRQRLCFALPSPADIRDGVAAFARVCAEQTGIPARSANVATRGG
jgi:DNA-binding transcriptional MocR family regulator